MIQEQKSQILILTESKNQVLGRKNELTSELAKLRNELSHSQHDFHQSTLDYTELVEKLNLAETQLE